MNSPIRSLTELPYGLPGKIFRSPLPFSPLFDPGGQLLEAFLAVEVDLVVMLTEPEEVLALTGLDLEAQYQDLGFDVLSVPVVDFSVPEKEPFRAAIMEVQAAAQSGQTVVVHCHAGIGRTGMFTASMAKEILRLDGRSAVEWVRQYIPDAVENQRQFQFVMDY